MGGFFGIGGSGVKTDRANQLQAVTDLKNIYNWGMPTGQAQVQKGTGNLDAAAKEFQDLLTGGRTATAERAAPAINATLAKSDAEKRQAEAQGTSRSGGTAAAGAERESAVNAQIDDLIAQALSGGREKGAEGLAQIGRAEAGIGQNLVGMGTGIQQDILSQMGASRETTDKIAQEKGQAYGQAAAQLALAFL